MANRAEIINIFEKCIISGGSLECCRECYQNGPGFEIVCRENVCADVLALLKEQEPVKPFVDVDEYKCPECKVKLTRQELMGDNVLFEDFFDYCPRCGRKVKWDG